MTQTKGSNASLTQSNQGNFFLEDETTTLQRGLYAQKKLNISNYPESYDFQEGELQLILKGLKHFKIRLHGYMKMH